ncbi:MAG: PIG-L family deacetylase [Opitutus sp.]|nr:PIG-L family deacetylase [Opitutus sp.]
MKRRNFIEKTLAAGAVLGGGAMVRAAVAAPSAPTPPPAAREAGGTGGTSYNVAVTVERAQAGQPHRGKVLAAIQPHCDDIPIFAGGTVLKLIDEGYEGILITMTDDSMAGTGRSHGDLALKNENDTKEVAKRLGLKESFFLNYPNHNMDAWPIVEMRARLIFLFRALKVDTVVVYDPNSLYERNPDHYVTARAVESACWMARSEWDYPEHFKAGLTAHGPQEKYYFSRGPQLVNRVVDIGPYLDRKVAANLANVTQGPAGETGAKLRRSLAAKGRKLTMLGDNDETANREYARRFALGRDRECGRAYGLEYAEYFHYIGPDASDADDFVRGNAVPL